MIHIRENNLRRILAAGLLLAVGQTVSAMPFSARDNFKDGLAWYEKSGVWTVQEGVYRQTDQKANPAMSYFGDRGWKDYCFKAKARRLSKTGGLLFCAAVSAEDTYVYLLVREHNSELGVRTMGTVQVQVGEPVGIADHQWHEVEIKAGIGKGQEWDRLQYRFQCFLDGKLVFDKQWRLNEFTKRGIFIVDEVHVRGAVALGTEAASAEFKDVRVDGTIMEDAHGTQVYSAKPVAIANFVAQYILCDPGQAEKVRIWVRNREKEPAPVQVKFYARQELQAERPAGETQAVIPPGETKEIAVQVPTGGRDWGQEVRAELVRDGKVIDEALDYFMVSDRPHTVTPIYSAQPDDYSGVTEAGRLDVDGGVNLAPKGDLLIGTTAADSVKPDDSRAAIRSAKERGQKVTPYLSPYPSGIAGTEWVRQHPELIGYGSDGTPLGGMSAEAYDLTREYLKTRNPKILEKEPIRNSDPNGFFLCMLNYTEHPELADILADQMILAKDEYGIDGFRFDSHLCSNQPTDPNSPSAPKVYNVEGKLISGPMDACDEAGARNTVRMMERIRKKYPHYLFGFNIGFESARQGCLKMYEAEAKGGNHILWESINALSSSSYYLNRWEDYAAAVAKEAEFWRQREGQLYLGWFTPGTPLFHRYIHILAYAGGAHIAGQGNSYIRLITQFAAHYSGLMFDPRRERLAEPENWARVSPEAALIWKPFVYRQADTADQHLLRTWVHVVHRPPKDRADREDETLQSTVENTTVRLKIPPKTRLKAVRLLGPEWRKHELTVVPGTADGWVTVTIPSFRYWAVVVAQWEATQ
jgi:hypothetical protein